MNNNFKCLELPCGDDGWVVEVKEGDDMRQLFAKIKDLAYFVSGNKFEGHSSWKLHKAAEALTDLWMAAHAMSYFRVLSKYDSISDFFQSRARFTLKGLGKSFSFLQSHSVTSEMLRYSHNSFVVNNSFIFVNSLDFIKTLYIKYREIAITKYKKYSKRLTIWLDTNF